MDKRGAGIASIVLVALVAVLLVSLSGAGAQEMTGTEPFWPGTQTARAQTLYPPTRTRVPMAATATRTPAPTVQPAPTMQRWTIEAIPFGWMVREDLVTR